MNENYEEIVELKRINRYLIQLAGAGLAAERQKHEVRRMLGHLRASVKRLAKLCQGTDEGVVREFEKLELIITSLNDAALKHDKVITSKYAHREKELELRDVINNSIMISEHQLDKNKIKVSVSGQSFKVIMPEGALMQVITNIISNSIDALSESPLEDKEIKIILEQTQRTMFICDSGEGIPQKYQDKIFQIFFTTKENQGGTGIGLHLVKELLEKSNYSITLANPTEHNYLLNGACFKITF